MHGIEEVLGFWFHEDTKRFWFEPTPAFDQTIRKRFAELFARAVTGELSTWESSPRGCLALCILLDQMPRSMFRGNHQAFGSDDRGLAVAERALGQGFDHELSQEEKQFLYMPFTRSEELANQLRAFALFEAAGLREGATRTQERMAIIRRFGRFPHRNDVLGRPSTAEEIEFLESDGELAPPPSAPPLAPAGLDDDGAPAASDDR